MANSPPLTFIFLSFSHFRQTSLIFLPSGHFHTTNISFDLIKIAKESTTPNKATKPVKAKASLANVSSATIDRDLVFLWKCVKMSTGMKVSVSELSLHDGTQYDGHTIRKHAIY